VYLQAPDHSIRFANRYYREQFGDPEGLPCYKSLWGRDEPCEVCPTFKVFDTGEPQIWEWDHAPNGKCYEVYDYPFTDIDGTKLVLEMGTDITDRKRAEEALRLRFDLEELLTSISTEFISLEPDEIDDGIGRVLESIIETVCVDRGYIFLYSPDGATMDNTHECCRSGVPPHKDRLKDVPVERFAWFDARMKRFETVAVDSVANLIEEAGPEKEEWLYENIQSLLCVPMVSRDRLMGFVGFDTVLYETQWREEIITFVRILGTVFANALDRKRSGQERERLLKTLAAKNEELQSIVYVASHDLKSPLVNIQGFSGELGKTCEQIDKVLHGEEVPADIQKQLAPLLDEDIPESISFIRAGTVKMQALLNGLLEVCRVGNAVLQIKAIDMNKMTKHIIASMQYQITDSGAELTADDLPGCIGDPDHVNQVFSNLLANAVKYLDPDRKGRIHISGRVEDGESIYCVRDNGLGIAPQHQQKVFEIFHRLEPDRHAEGEGLGLTIALRILERHEGRIWVESEPGKGSRFFVSLPTA
jgi:signal transduction histidine kinase